MTSYSTLIETMRLSCTVFELLSLIAQNMPLRRRLLSKHFWPLNLIVVSVRRERVGRVDQAASSSADQAVEIFRVQCRRRTVRRCAVAGRTRPSTTKPCTTSRYAGVPRSFVPPARVTTSLYDTRSALCQQQQQTRSSADAEIARHASRWTRC